ncbi:GNAT family N-acetyltransferase [Alphaproteobacteria bacterium LSUCC0684]
MDDEINSADAGTVNWTITLNESIHAIPAEDWDRCARSDNPLQSHALLAAMEDSSSAVADTGWLPRHISLADPDGRIHGVMPLYLKSHSYGEYVFDHSWANAWHQAGGAYYPKAQSAIPFSPVPGQRLMVESPYPAEAFAALAQGAMEAVEAMGLSSLHVTFLSEDESRRLATLNPAWIRRTGLQFHWHNQGYADFEDFLGRLSSRKRKTLRRERRDIALRGIRIHRLTGDDLRADHWDAFYRFYLATIDRKWGGAYLTRDFFDRIGATMADKVMLFLAEHDGEMIAGALNFIGKDTLYGRNWGAVADIPFLHFETCYYQAIDLAIELGLSRVEAGAQGLHKVQRGYLPVMTFSAHYLKDEGFARAVREFTSRESRQIQREADALKGWSPYRNSED